MRYDNLYTIPHQPLPDFEGVLEFTHRIELKPCWYLQPGVMYILHPGGSAALSDALVIGLRATISF